MNARTTTIAIIALGFMARAFVSSALAQDLDAPKSPTTLAITADPQAKPRATSRPFHVTVGVSPATNNIALGLDFCYRGYFKSTVAGDFLTSALLNGFDHDDLDAIRFTAGQTVGARLSAKPFGLKRRCGDRVKTSRHPDVVAGIGVWGVSELDSLSQTFRLDDSGIYLAWATGMFVSFEFSDVAVALMFRPFEQTAYRLDGAWDSTPFAYSNPVLEIDFTYVIW